MLWTLDDERDDDVLSIRFNYFETPEPLLWDAGPRTYTDGDASSITNTRTAEWNHGLGEIVQAVLDAGFALTGLIEHRECDWAAIPALMDRDDEGRFHLRDRPARLPLMYTLQATKAA
jgi:hypothetical protein